MRNKSQSSIEKKYYKKWKNKNDLQIKDKPDGCLLK